MNKLLIAVLFAAAGVLAWLMLSKPASLPTARPEVRDSATQDAPTATRAPGRPAPLTAPPPAARPLPVVSAPASGAAPQSTEPPPRRVTSGTVIDGVQYGRRPEDGPVSVGTTDLKDSVRRYWNALPKSGAMPKSVPAEDVLPRALLGQMNIPAGSRITMIGDYPTDHPQAFPAFFATRDDTMTMKGFSFVTPDGVEVRDYVRMKPLKENPK